MAAPKKTGARMSAETLIARNAKLMREFSIETTEDLIKALGDRYCNEVRKALMDRLSDKDRILLRDFYYHNCPAGLDRRPACVKVTIDWAHSKMWIPKDRDYIQTIKAEFDRIKLRVTFKCQTQQGTQVTFKASLDEAFAEEFFSLADSAWWEDPKMHSGINAFDAFDDEFRITTVFKRKIPEESIQRVPINAVCNGGVDNPDAVGLHLGHGNVNQIQAAFFAGCRRDGRVHRPRLCIIPHRKTHKNEISVAKMVVPFSAPNGQNECHR